MKKSTKVLTIFFIITTIASVFFARYVFFALSFNEGTFNYDFNAYSISGIALSALSMIFGGIVFLRFIKSLPLDRAIFFSSVPLVVVYGLAMFWLSGLANYQNEMAQSISSALNITKENQYNTILWAIIVSFVFVLILFMNYFFLARPVSKIERVLMRLGDGKIRNEKIKLGGTVQFHNIEHCLNKINNNYQARDFVEVSKRKKRSLSKNLWRFFGKKEILSLDKGHTVRKMATVMLLKLIGNEDKNNIEETFYLAKSYFHTISPLIDRFDGFIDESFGDGIMVVYPSAVKALEGIAAISKAVDSLNRKNKTHFSLKMKTITTSREIEFFLSNEKPKIVAKGIELLSVISQSSENLQIGAIFSKELLDCLPLEYKFAYRYVGTITFENKETVLFENLEVVSQERQRKMIKTKNVFEKGVQFYQSQMWNEALLSFEKVLKYDSSDKCAYIYFNKCREKIV